MRHLIASVLFAAALPATAADPVPPPKPEGSAAVDTSFLRLYAETRGFMLGRPQKPKVTPDGKAVLFLRAEPKTPKLKLYEFDVATKATKELLSPETLLHGADENLSAEEKARRERQRVTVGGFADYHLDEGGTRVLVSLAGRLYVFDRATGKAAELKTGPGSALDPKWSPDGKQIAYVRGFDVYAYDLASGKETAVTTGGTREKTHGIAEFVAQEEMDRHSGYWWSPDSKRIAYTEADHAGVEVWAIADPLRPDKPPQEQYYPRPGRKNVSVRLGVVDVAGGKTTWVEWDRAKYEYLAAVKWDKGGPLTVQLQDRKQQAVALLEADPATGVAKTLLTETDTAFVNLRHGQPAWLPGGRGFLWTTDDGRHDALTWRSPSGERKGVVSNPTPGYQAVGINSLSPDGSAVALDVRDETTTGVLWFRWEDAPNHRKTFELVHGRGQNAAVLGQDHRRYVTTGTGLTGMPRSAVDALPADAAGSGEHLGTLPSVALEPPFKPNVRVEKVGDYYTAVVRPRDLDPKKKYPVVVDVYGGPHHLHVQQAMRNWLVPQWLADQGFIVVALDNRGTPGRGREWERAIYQKLGTVPLEDQVKGLHALCDKFPELDRTRVGIVGWSFGGYMAANAVLRRPDVFHAAVAGAPVTDWEDYDTHYTERYMGLLPASQKAYDEASLIPLAPKLTRPLLLVHGTADDNVYFRHTLKLSDALLRAGRPFEVLPLPGVTHLYSTDPTVTERLWAKTATFFRGHLGGPK